jgi:hypothetical protein
MGRSVNYLNNAEYINYIDTLSIQDSCEWEDFKCNIASIIKNRYKSFSECDEWEGNETKVILENNLAIVGISEYCGLTSISIAPKEFIYYEKDNTALAIKWINSISDNLEKLLDKNFECYRKVGTFSNGESVYSK